MTFFTKLFIFLVSRWNISTNETVFERLLNFWNSETYVMTIPHPVQVREPPKDKKLKIRVARKSDLIEPNQVYSFSSFIRLYQTHIVRPILFSISFNLLDRVIDVSRSEIKNLKIFERSARSVLERISDLNLNQNQIWIWTKIRSVQDLSRSAPDLTRSAPSTLSRCSCAFKALWCTATFLS